MSGTAAFLGSLFRGGGELAVLGSRLNGGGPDAWRLKLEMARSTLNTTGYAFGTYLRVAGKAHEWLNGAGTDIQRFSPVPVPVGIPLRQHGIAANAAGEWGKSLQELFPGGAQPVQNVIKSALNVGVQLWGGYGIGAIQVVAHYTGSQALQRVAETMASNLPGAQEWTTTPTVRALNHGLEQIRQQPGYFGPRHFTTLALNVVGVPEFALGRGLALARRAVTTLRRADGVGDGVRIIDQTSVAGQLDAPSLPARVDDIGDGARIADQSTGAGQLDGSAIRGYAPGVGDRLTRLAEGNPIDIRPIGGTTANSPDLVVFDNGATGVFKPDTPNSGFRYPFVPKDANAQNVRELAAFALDSKYLDGYAGVPAVVQRSVGDRPGIVVDYLAGGVSPYGNSRVVTDRFYDMVEVATPAAHYRRIAFFDELIGNLDRNPGNVLWDPASNSWVPIDHGLAFPEDIIPGVKPVGTTAFETPVRLGADQRELLENLFVNRPQIEQELSGLLSPGAIEGIFDRAQKMLDRGWVSPNDYMTLY
ncbi:MAG: hypothetical protein AB1758_05330 [Candidatus Eremiobacterota bacterium]